MMNDRMQEISQGELNVIHDASMEILKKVGIAFHEPEAVAIFKKHGVKTDGKVVYPDERIVEKALDSAPAQFTITAQDPANNVIIGGENLVFAPGYGAAFIVSDSGEQSQATLDDYDNFCKLVQTSTQLDINGLFMVTPWDVPAETVHLDMLFSNMTLCDKVFMGCSLSRQAAIDTVEMAGIALGGKTGLKNTAVTLSLISSLSPLQFTREMSGALIEFTSHGQPVVVAAGPKAGSSGPVTLAGLLALQNAEILAGISLAQLVRPGAPVAYGGISGPMDLKTGTIPYGAPELSKMTSAIAQMARHYKIPGRSGGALTDAHLPDIQAGIESTFALTTAARNGIHLIIHGCGILSSFLAMNYEKFVIDEALCGMIRNLLQPIRITMAEIDLKTIAQVGIGGEYLTHQTTFDRCKTEFFQTELMNRLSYESWAELGMKRLESKAKDRVRQRLSDYVRPDIEPDVEKELSFYVSKRKNG